MVIKFSEILEHKNSIMNGEPGLIVKHIVSKKLGRTYTSKGLINGKVPVYFASTVVEMNNVQIIQHYEDKASLCFQRDLITIGFIN